MIIPSTSREIRAKPHSKSPTSYPHSNENQNRNTHNSNTISHSRHETAYLIISNPAPPFKSQFYLHYLIITIPANPTTSTSYSYRISQCSAEYPHSQPSPQITLFHLRNHIMSLYNSPQILPPLKNTHSPNPTPTHLFLHFQPQHKHHPNSYITS